MITLILKDSGTGTIEYITLSDAEAANIARMERERKLFSCDGIPGKIHLNDAQPGKVRRCVS